MFLLVSCKKEQKLHGHLYDAPAYDFGLTSQNNKRVKLSDFLKEKRSFYSSLDIPSVQMYVRLF